jgi:non-heme chloroperoxidase
MDAVGLEAAVIVGHSAGTVTAQRLAVDHPERTLGVVLIGGAPTFAGNPAVEELWHIVAGLDDPVDPGFVRMFQESTVTRPVPAAFLDAVIAESRKLPAPGSGRRRSATCWTPVRRPRPARWRRPRCSSGATATS